MDGIGYLLKGRSLLLLRRLVQATFISKGHVFDAADLQRDKKQQKESDKDHGKAEDRWLRCVTTKAKGVEHFFPGSDAGAIGTPTARKYESAEFIYGQSLKSPSNKDTYGIQFATMGSAFTFI